MKAQTDLLFESINNIPTDILSEIGKKWGMIDINDLIKGETYINPNTGDEFIFNRYEITDKNKFAVDTDGSIHIAQKFRKENR